MEKSGFKIEKGSLYVVATPIGNMGDITLRGKEVLQQVNFIACEDTRVTGKLLNNLGIKNKMVPYFQHSKVSKLDYIADQLKKGESVAMVSDAGTPDRKSVV